MYSHTVLSLETPEIPQSCTQRIDKDKLIVISELNRYSLEETLKGTKARVLGTHVYSKGGYIDEYGNYRY